MIKEVNDIACFFFKEKCQKRLIASKIKTLLIGTCI
jgi:hypothetical protein